MGLVQCSFTITLNPWQALLLLFWLTLENDPLGKDLRTWCSVLPSVVFPLGINVDVNSQDVIEHECISYQST